MSTRNRIACCLASIAGVAALSCSDPALTAPKAALSMTIGGGTSGVCAWPGTGANIPAPQNLVGASSSQQRPERELIDSCRVAPDGTGAFIVTGGINNGDVVFNLSTLAPISNTAGQVSITFQEERLPPTGVRSVPGAPCTARALEYLPEGGAIFLEFSCPTIEDEFSVGSTCATTNARVIFENCVKTLPGTP